MQLTDFGEAHVSPKAANDDAGDCAIVMLARGHDDCRIGYTASWAHVIGSGAD